MARIFRWLKINPDEIKLFLWVALLLFLVNVASILLNNYAETAFLKRFGVEYLPVVTAINAVVTFVLFSVIGSRLSNQRGDRVVAKTLIASAIFCGLLRFVVPLGFSLIYPILYILKTQFTVLLAFLFWDLVNDLFSTRQAKRLFPLITAGGILGSLLGSFATPLLIRVTTPDNLLLLFPLVATIAAFCSLRLGSLAPGALSQAQPKSKNTKAHMLNEFHQVAPLVKGSTLAQVLLLLTLLPNIIIPILNYQFSFVVNATFSNEVSMIDFYSYFRGAQNTIALLLSLFVGRLYGRVGLPVALMFHPANYILAFGAYLFQFNIFSAVYAGVSVGVLRRTIQGPASRVLYGLLLPKDRAILRPFLRGTVVRIGILFGSGLLLVANEFIHPRYLSLFALIFCFGWLAATLLLKRNYSTILIDLVQNALPEFHKMGKKDFKDIFRSTKIGDVLLERFRAARGEEAALNAAMLQQANPELLDEAILAKLPQTDDQTRLRLLPYLSEQTGSRAVDTFLTFIDPSKPELMVALARTIRRVYLAMTPGQEQEVFERAKLTEVKAWFLGWMNDSEPQQFDQLIESWLASDAIENRRAGVLAIGEVCAERQIPNLAKVLTLENDPSVLALALHSLRRFPRDSRVDDLLKPFLHHPNESVRLAAISSMPLETDVEVNSLIHGMADTSERVRKQAISHLEKLPSDKHHLLVAKMGTNGRWMREGLFQVAATLELGDLDVIQFCRNQLRASYETLELSKFYQDKPQNAATKMALEHLDEVRRLRTYNALGVLAGRDHEGGISIALEGLKSGGARERSDSIEALESLLDKSLLDLLLPMLDDRPQAERLAVGRKLLGLKALNDETAVTRALDDPNWVSVIMMLECLAIWGEVNLYQARIKEIIDENFGAVVHTAEHAFNSNDGTHEEALSCLIERINIIRKVDLFKGLTIGQLAAVAWQSEVEMYSSEQVVTSSEHSGRGLLLVVKGEIIFWQTYANDRCEDREIHRIEADEWFGAAIMFGMTPPATMISRAAGETLLLRINRDDFYTLTNQYPDIALRVCNGLSKVLGDVMADLKSRPTKSPVTLLSDAEALNGSFCKIDGEYSLVDRIFFLRQIDLFSQLENLPLTSLAIIGEELSLGKGTSFQGSDTGARGLYMILEGELSLYQGNKLFDRKAAGSYFGLATLFGLNIDDFSFKAEENSLLLKILPEEFRASVLSHPIIAVRACERLSQVQGSLIDEILESEDCNCPPENVV